MNVQVEKFKDDANETRYTVTGLSREQFAILTVMTMFIRDKAPGLTEYAQPVVDAFRPMVCPISMLMVMGAIAGLKPEPGASKGYGAES